MVRSEKNKDRDTQDAILTRLDVIIRLLLDEASRSKKITRNDQLLTLHSTGLTPVEIARIIGWDSPRAVSNQISKLRSVSKRSRRDQKENSQDAANDKLSTDENTDRS